MLAIDLVLYVALAWYFDQVRVRVGVRVLRPRSPLSSP